MHLSDLAPEQRSTVLIKVIKRLCKVTNQFDSVSCFLVADEFAQCFLQTSCLLNNDCVYKADIKTCIFDGFLIAHVINIVPQDSDLQVSLQLNISQIPYIRNTT